MTTWPKAKGDVEALPTQEAQIREIKQKTSRFMEPFRSVNQWIPDEAKLTRNNLSYWIPVPWNNHGGRVTLAGDAAHAMTFHRGQGLQHGIVDVQSLVRAIKKVIAGTTSLSDAISDYDTDVVKRAGEEVRVSKLNTEMIHDWERFLQSPGMVHGVSRTHQQEQKVLS